MDLQIEVEGDVYTLYLPPNPEGPRPTWLLKDEDAFMHALREHPQYVSCSGPAGAKYVLTFNSQMPAPEGTTSVDYIKGFITATANLVGFVPIHT